MTFLPNVDREPCIGTKRGALVTLRMRIALFAVALTANNFSPLKETGLAEAVAQDLPQPA